MSYKYYYNKILRPRLIDKYSILNINDLVFIKEVILYFYLLNTNKETDVQFLKASFLLEFLSGQKSYLSGFKFKFKFDSDEINFFLKVNLHGDKLYNFLTYLYVALEKVKITKNISINNKLYLLSFKQVKVFYNVNALEDDYFQWNKYLNVNLVLNKPKKLNDVKLKSIISSLI